MNIIGFLFILIGSVVIWLGISMSGAASYSDTLNIGLLNSKSNTVICGCFLFLSGIVLMVGDRIINELEKLNANLKNMTAVDLGSDDQIALENGSF